MGMRRHGRLQPSSSPTLDVQVEELQLDSPVDMDDVVATVEVAVTDFFARDGFARELADRTSIGSIDLGSHDGRTRAQNVRSRVL